MFNAEHPTYRELLLLDSGELDAERVPPVEQHVAECPDCQAELAKVRMVCGTVAASVEPQSQPRVRSLVKRRARPIVATIVAISVTGYLLTKGTPAARANEVLRRAIVQQTSEPRRFKPLRIQGSAGQCYTVNDAGIEQVTTGNSRFCRSVASTLRTAGWEEKDLLSAKRFQSWRSFLSKKKDAVREADGATQITTATEEGRLRLASLSIRNSDDHPVAAHYEFVVNQEERATFDVVESEPLPSVAVTDPVPPPTPSKQPAAVPAAIPDVLPVRPEINPADLLETRIRLALHAIGADGSPTLDVEKGPLGFRVWGVVSDEKTKQALRQNLQGIVGVTIEVVSEAESQRADKPVPIPWSGFRGDAPPLAQEEIGKLFPNDPPARQRFLNDLDRLTRQLAGETRTRDALRKLAGRMRSSPDAENLNRALADLDARVARSTQQLAQQLAPLIGAVTPAATQKLTFPQAMELYAVVQQTVLLSAGASDLTLSQAIDRIVGLLQ